MAGSCGLPVLLLHAAAVAAFGGAEEAKEFVLVKLPNAKCLDGSPAVYYIAANASSSSWVVYVHAHTPPGPRACTPMHAFARPGPGGATPRSLAHAHKPKPTPHAGGSRAAASAST